MHTNITDYNTWDTFLSQLRSFPGENWLAFLEKNRLLREEGFFLNDRIFFNYWWICNIDMSRALTTPAIGLNRRKPRREKMTLFFYKGNRMKQTTAAATKRKKRKKKKRRRRRRKWFYNRIKPGKSRCLPWPHSCMLAENFWKATRFFSEKSFFLNNWDYLLESNIWQLHTKNNAVPIRRFCGSWEVGRGVGMNRANVWLIITHVPLHWSFYAWITTFPNHDVE